MDRKYFENFVKSLKPNSYDLGTWFRQKAFSEAYNSARLACRKYECKLAEKIDSILNEWDKQKGDNKRLSWPQTEQVLFATIADTQKEMNKNRATCMVEYDEEPANYNNDLPIEHLKYKSQSRIKEKYLPLNSVVKQWTEKFENDDSLGMKQ